MTEVTSATVPTGANDAFVLGGRTFSSRLIVGTGKYKDAAETERAIEASGAELITVALRRVDLADRAAGSLMDMFVRRTRHFGAAAPATGPDTRWTLLPNTAGCSTADEAVRTLRLARELGMADLVKLEVIGDPKTLYPDNEEPHSKPRAKVLVKEGFVGAAVLHRRSDHLSKAGRRGMRRGHAACRADRLAASASAIRTTSSIILEHARVPVIVDAGVGTASDATVALELGCHGVLVNTAIAHARDPVLMATAMKGATAAGRQAFLAGRMGKTRYANASSPTAGLIE